VSPSLRDFDYDLPPELIAQSPHPQRDASRLLALCRADGQTRHHVFAELPSLLRKGDLLVLNDTRVIPAKFSCRRGTGGKVDGLFLREISSGVWEVLLRNVGRGGAGGRIALVGAEDVRLELRENLGEGRWRVGVDPPGSAIEVLQRAGRTPLPPYIRRAGPSRDQADRDRYQTVHAAKPGAVAAPTAGLHFTAELLEKLRRRGVGVASVTLHVGLGTFAPVKAQRLEEHEMHAEWYELPGETADLLNAARREGRRVIAVGTTSVRVLETVAAQPQATGGQSRFSHDTGWTDIFIHPPCRFRAVDALITNFHLPRSTLLMLVAAFCSPGRTSGLGMILNAYREAIRLRYRFYSYGDAMLIE